MYTYRTTHSAPFAWKDYISEETTSSGIAPRAGGKALSAVPGRELRLPPPPTDEIRVVTVGRPVPGQDGVKEWTISIEGPERLLSRVREVVYALAGDPPTLVGQVKGEERWGDAGDGFSMRMTRADLPPVEATVRFDGDLPNVKATSAAAK